MKKRKMIAVLLSTVMLGSLAGCGSDVRTEGEKKMSYEDASSELSSLLKKVSIRTVSNPTLDIYMDETSKADALDDIDTFPITVRGNGDIDIEVAAATEMSADAPDDWMNVVAKNFNKEGYEIDGKTRFGLCTEDHLGRSGHLYGIRRISAAGLCPSNYAWGEMLRPIPASAPSSWRTASRAIRPAS